MLQIVIQYFDGCPNWKVTSGHLARLSEEGVALSVVLQRIDSHETAVALGFRGSPTILIEGVDAFADESAPIGLACRMYRTQNSSTGSPSLSQLRQAITSAARE